NMRKEQRKRARELGLIIGSIPPGPRNAISDVPGVLVGHSTLIEGKGQLLPGKGPIRTGVTAILPHEGNLFLEPVVGAVHIINGFGKAVGLAQVMELGRIETPILLTSTLNVGIVEDAVTQYVIEHNPQAGIRKTTPNPIVAECHDGYLNDAQGRHVRQPHVYEAIQKASTKVEEGCVGVGTGMMAYGYKSGVGTASRVLPEKQGGYIVGSLVVPNCGRKGELILNGSPITKLLKQASSASSDHPRVEGGSIVVIIATNAPLSSRQLGRIARRAVIGIGRTGSVVSHGSGDFVIAFSTAHREPEETSLVTIERTQLHESVLTAYFGAVVEVTEEAIVNALFMATNMKGRDNHIGESLPIEELPPF
ncbi:MAG: P1 family peptidase, partial [Candidatus Thorarchaeota archaeon]